MKKFTTNFSGERYRSSLRIFRSIALGFVALVWAHSTALAQYGGGTCPPPDSTVHFYADDVAACYSANNLYKVKVSVMDFNKVDSLHLVLNYNTAYWTFVSATVLENEFKQTNPGPNGTNSPMTIVGGGGTVTFDWAELVARGYIPASMGAQSEFAELVFSLNNFPNNSLSTYSTTLEWDSSSKVFHCGGGTNWTEWTDNEWVDGSITTNILYPQIEFTVDPSVVDCVNSTALVTVNSPVGAGFEYSYNGQASWTTDHTSSASPGTHSIQVKDADGCLSNDTLFTVEARDTVAYTVEVTNESCDRLGEINFTATGGVPPYTYWVVPHSDWNQVMSDMMLGKSKNDTIFDKYKFTTAQHLRPAGTYHLAVDDANGCVTISPALFGGIPPIWQDVTILDGADFDYEGKATVDTVMCHDNADGEYVVYNIAGDSAYYYVTVVDGAGATVYTADSVQVTDTISGLTPGDYEVSVSDGVCSKIKAFTIYNVDDPTFYVDYTDAPCTAGTGTLWISELNGDSIKNTTLDTTGWTFEVKGPGFDSIASISDTIGGIPANYYEVYLITDCSKIAFVNRDGTENTVPILDDGAITFNTEVKNETCFGDGDGYIRVIDVARSCDNCNEGAVYQFRVDSASWMAIADTFFATAQDTYLVEVRDSADPEVCIVGKDIIVSGPDSALVVVVDSVYAPTCHEGNDGWVRMRVTGGTEPYWYSVDNAPNWRPNMSFGLTEGDHLLQVRDANGCTWSDTISVDTLSGIEITAALLDTISCNGDLPSIDVSIDTFTWYSDSTDYTYYYTEVSGDYSALQDFKPQWDAHPTTFAPGTYYIEAKDPNGCWSTEDTVVIEGVLPLAVADPVVEDATCYGTWTGRVTLTVLQGNPDSVYYYAYANNPDYLLNPNAVINWYPFTVGDTAVAIEMMKGEYWFQIKDKCEETTPFQVVIDGYEPIEITSVDVTNVTCNGDNDGTITVNAAGGAPGAGVGNYLYTLMQNGVVVGTPMQTSNVFTGLTATNTAGYPDASPYTVYVYDTTDPNATPAMCTPDSQVVNINQPEDLYFKTHVSDVTCADAEDGVISVYIYGGVGGMYNYAGYNPGAATDGKAYKVTINGITGDRDYSLELDDAQDEVDFQVYGGDFEVIVEDANGCFIIDTVTVREPEPWVINTWYVDPSDCNVADGEIYATATGGYDNETIYWDINEFTNHASSMSGDTILLYSSAVYNTDYEITVYNSHKGSCVGKDTITLEVFNPFEFDVDVECVKCYGGNDGKVTISNITGGSGAYQIQLVGGDNPAYDASNNDLWWPVKADGTPDYVSTDIVFDTLKTGEYWIYLRDDAGFTLANCCRPIKFTMCEPDSLELNTVTWVKDADCAGDSTGAFSIQASGGTAPYQYTYSRTEVGSGGHPYPTLPENPVWYTDSVITNVPAGTYIGWVMDANGCVTGCEIDAQGFPIDDHRVVIREADALIFDVYNPKGDVCYGELTSLIISDVQGGSGATFTAEVTGTTFDGVDTTYVFPDLDVNHSHTLPVYASDADGYDVTLITSNGCRSESDTIVVTQLDEFTVDIEVTSGAVCEGDEEVLIVLNTTGGSTGGNSRLVGEKSATVSGPGYGNVLYDIYSDGVLIREDSPIDNHVVAVGHEYVVVAKDGAGCEATDTMMIEIPQAIVTSITDVSCNGDSLASVRVTAVGTPGRTFMVHWDEFENDVITHSDSSAWFAETTDIIEKFIFDSENINDIHYEFIIVDDQGCISSVDTLTFDPVQHPIELFVDVNGQNECSANVTLNVTGGIDPYVVSLNGDTITDMTMDLASGSYPVVVTDTHLRCKLETTVDIDSNPVVRDTSIETYIDEKVQFIDAEAGLDTMLAKGDYTFTYDYATGVDTCVRTLNVGVVEVPRPYTIAEVQGTGDTSPIDGKVAQIEGTVTAVADGEGFFVQDANAAWSGIWVEYSDVTTSGIQEGNGVVVVGVVGEIANVTSITATSVTSAAPSLTVAPIDVASPSEVSDEMYESVVVKVSGARADSADASTGEWTIYYEASDAAVVNDWLFAYTPKFDDYYNVTGVVNGRLDNFKLEPRKAADIVDVTDTKIGDLDGIEFKVYPNPFSNIINIENSDKLSRVVISNIAGQRVIDVEYPNSEIRTDNLVSGIYVISLITENGIAKTEKIIKK